MKTIQQHRKEFFEEGVSFYAYDTRRRAVINGRTTTCKYRIDKKRCMIGRHIPDENYSESIEGSGISDFGVYTLLPLKIQNLGLSFLESTQYFHDNHEYWNKRKGLTQKGKIQYQYILHQYCK